MPQDENWINLYEYVKKDIMGYSKDMKLNKYMVLRLKGLADGRFLANKTHKPMANYSFKTILYTFKVCKADILSAFKTNQTKFTNEEHRFNYAMVIIEKNINDMVIRLENAKQAKEKSQSLNLEHIFNEGAEYQTKTKEPSKNLKDLW